MSILTAIPLLLAFQDVAPRPNERVILSPTPAAGARFGYSVCWLDLDADGAQDLAVGAPGENAVYLFFGPELERVQRFAPEAAGEGDRFGNDVAAGEIDEHAGDELVVGAPGTKRLDAEGAGCVYMISRSQPAPQVQSFTVSRGAALGTSLAVGDFDGDGLTDIAAGAPKARVGGEPSGAITLHSPRKHATTGWNNPAGKSKHGNFGHDLAGADLDGNGKLDLVVSGIGNANAAGIAGAGQVYAYQDPVPVVGHMVLEDPDAQAGDGARFGMSIDAGDLDGDGYADVLVGAPRKDGGGIEDAGLGFVFFGPGFSEQRSLQLLRPDAKPHDLLGYRALAADLVGGPEPDAVFGSLARDNPHALVVWDVAGSTREPEKPAADLVLEAPEGRSSHPFQGLAAAPPSESARATLALGDARFGTESSQESGRVVIWRFAR